MDASYVPHAEAVGLDAIRARMRALEELIAAETEAMAANEREYEELAPRLRGHIDEHERLRDKVRAFYT